jgi:hypothetical protein
MEHAQIDQFANEGIIDVKNRQIINDPLIYAQHWPSKASSDSNVALRSNAPVDFSMSEKKSFLSLYHGDFEQIGSRLVDTTDGLRDFTLIANVPYGIQS